MIAHPVKGEIIITFYVPICYTNWATSLYDIAL